MEWEELELNPGALPMGSQVGTWRVRGWAGRGTYGTVYRAVRVGQEGAPPVALKLAMYAQDERYGREVELLSRVRHPSVPKLVDHGVWRHRLVGAYPYLVMEWLEGVALYPWASERNPSSRQVLRVLAQVARALEATHGVSAVHRDVKGANIRVRPSDGRVFLLDFGAGHYAGAAPLTRPPMVPGTPAYRSPEASTFLKHFAGGGARYEARPSDDVFALGVTAYRLVTDEYPPSTDWGDVEARRWWEEGGGPPAPRELNPRVDAQLNALISRMLSVKPEARGSTSELAGALERAAEYASAEADEPLFEWETVPPSQWSKEETFEVEMWGHRLRRREAQAPAVAEAARSPSSASAPMRSRGWGLLGLLGAGWFATTAVFKGQGPEAEAVPQVLTLTHEASTAEHHEAGEVSVGERALEASTASVRAPVKEEAIGLPMPKEPLEGQRRAPRCERPLEITINGGCWIQVTYVKPPCGKRVYEWKGACYTPSFPPKREPTSDKP